jgi:N-methylhydantoinase B
VVIAADGSVDALASDALRATLRAKRGPTIPTFDYGPPIEQLRANSLADTGLEAPKQPVWSRSAEPLALAAE